MKVIRVINKQERIELIKEIAAYYIENNGEMTLHELADTYGRPYGTVYNWMMNQLPKIDAELYSQFRDSMRNERNSQYSKGTVRIHREYSCLPAILRNTDFKLRVFVLFQTVCSNRTIIPDWDELNNLLFHDVDTHGFNLISRIESYKDLAELYNLVKTANSNPHTGSWHTRTCKRCGKSFTLSLGNYQFFSGDGMYLPNTCPSCRRNKRRSRHNG